MTRRGMGRGLAAILPESASTEPELRHLPVDLIRPNPAQPRTRFDPASIERLAASLADAGVVQPLIVRPLGDGRYELIAGERRWRAAREAGLQTVPVVVRDDEEAERRAKRAVGRGRPKVVPHPDQEAALARAQDALEAALGADVRVRAARRGIRAELQFDDLDQLLAFARERGA